jgi:1-acyl-sn-glycerol-3-phosphate acyltransferase
MLAFVTITLLLASVAVVSALVDRSGDTVMKLGRFWSLAIMRASGVKLTIQTDQPLDPKRSYVFMSNHLSAADIFSLFIAVPFPVRMIAKKSLGQIPFFGWAMHAGRFIFIDRQNPIAARRSIEEAARRITNGHSVLLFPEGTRSRDGYLGPFKKGGFHLAIASGASIVPVGIRGSREVMRPRSLLIYRGAISVHIGAPISTDGMVDSDRDALLESTRALIRDMTGQADRPAPPAPAPSVAHA